jgi:hypothetical protein
VTGELRASHTCKCSSAHHGARAGPSGSRRRLHGRLLPKMKLAPDPQHEHPRADRPPASRHTKQRAALSALSPLGSRAVSGDALRGRPRHGREARRCCRDDRVPDHICPVCPGSVRCFCRGNNVSTARPHSENLDAKVSPRAKRDCAPLLPGQGLSLLCPPSHGIWHATSAAFGTSVHRCDHSGHRDRRPGADSLGVELPFSRSVLACTTPRAR